MHPFFNMTLLTRLHHFVQHCRLLISFPFCGQEALSKIATVRQLQRPKSSMLWVAFLIQTTRMSTMASFPACCQSQHPCPGNTVHMRNCNNDSLQLYNSDDILHLQQTYTAETLHLRGR